jgi:hypothetical protein
VIRFLTVVSNAALPAGVTRSHMVIENRGAAQFFGMKNVSGAYESALARFGPDGSALGTIARAS